MVIPKDSVGDYASLLSEMGYIKQFESDVANVCQLPTAEAVGFSVDSRSNSKLEWTLDVPLTFNVPDFRAS